MRPRVRARNGGKAVPTPLKVRPQAFKAARTKENNKRAKEVAAAAAEGAIEPEATA